MILSILKISMKFGVHYHHFASTYQTLILTEDLRLHAVNALNIFFPQFAHFQDLETFFKEEN